MATLELENVHLAAGAHARAEGGTCVMELISVLAGEAWSDAPACVAPTLRAYAVVLNDDAPDEVRQRLRDYIPRLMGTAPEPLALAERRGNLCADRAVRVFAPLALAAAGMAEDAARLRGLPQVVDRQSAAVARRAAAAAGAAAGAANVANVAYTAAYTAAFAADGAYAAVAAAAAGRVIDAASDAAGAAGHADWDEAYRLLDDLLTLGEATIVSASGDVWDLARGGYVRRPVAALTPDAEWEADRLRRLGDLAVATEARRAECRRRLWPSKRPRSCWTCGVELSPDSRGNGFCGSVDCKRQAGATAERRAR